MAKELLSEDIIVPCDSKSLGELFHSYGVNIRYIGQLVHICDSISKENIAYIQILLERIMLAKSIKHYIRNWLTVNESRDFAETIASLFNRVFSPNRIIEQLENNNQQSSAENQEICVQNKTHIRETETEINDSFSLQNCNLNFESSYGKLQKLKPSEVWKRLKEICQKRYLYELPEKIQDFRPFQYPLTKLATLRDVCLSTGIVLECKKYDLIDSPVRAQDSSKLKKQSSLPFQSSDIFDTIPIVKHLDPHCEDAKSQIDLVIIKTGKRLI